ncbi:hypothetical protein BDW66DRAFT_133642 [Aspergillus desertorum]
MTTTELRIKDFQLIMDPGTDGTATGSLYLEMETRLRRPRLPTLNSSIAAVFSTLKGQFMRDVNIESVILLGQTTTARAGEQRKKHIIETRLELTAPTSVKPI